MSCRVSLCEKRGSRFKNSPSASLMPHCCPHLFLSFLFIIVFLPAFTFRVSLLSFPLPCTLFFFFFLLSLEACRILVPQPRIEPKSLAMKAQSPNLQTTREVPALCF